MTAPDPDTPATFETELARLEEIVDRLSTDSVSLDEALRLFEEGVSRLRAVTGRLSAAEARIALLSERDDGSFDLEDFEG